MKTEHVASYVLEDIVKQPRKTRTRMHEFIVLKEISAGRWTSGVEILNNTRYTNKNEAFDAALADANYVASNSNAYAVKNCKASSTKEICIAVVSLEAHARLLCCYRVLQLP